MKHLLVFLLLLILDFGSSSSQQVALILARGGSKGIPLKNLAKLGGKSLLCRSIQTLQEVSGKYSGLYVSTDHPLIAQEAETCNATVHWRSAETARDETTSLESVQEFLGKHPEVDRVALIQCTSPFTQAEYLHEAFELTEECVFAVRRSHEFRWTKRDGQVIPLNLNPLKRPRRQDWRGELVETGMFYFATRQLILSGSFQSNRCGVVEVSSEDSLQIDSPLDLELAEILLQQRSTRSVQ